MNVLIFLFKCKIRTCPPIFFGLFTEKPQNKYNMRSKGTLIEPISKTKLERFSISFRAPHLWNKMICPSIESFQTESLSVFKTSVKKLVFEYEDIKRYF